MRLSELQYDLPSELIAQHAATPRDASRLLVLERSSGRIEHRMFREIGEYLAPGDCLVLNDTRVIPARFFCQRQSGGKVEGLFLHEDGDGWRVLLKPAARLKVGERLTCMGSATEPIGGMRLGDRAGCHGQPEVARVSRRTGKLRLPMAPDRHRFAHGDIVVIARQERGQWLVRPEPPVSSLAWLAEFGRTPLPPYIRRGAGGQGDPEPADAERYQTVYAARPGAVAAPTAGLHFTADLLERLAARGVRRADVTLHVGAGTFVPIRAEDLAEHQMHAEWYEVTGEALAKIQAARADGRRIVAVGTTSARVLESLPDDTLSTADTAVPQGAMPAPPGASGWTNIFIYPPYQFRHVDRLLTNFHLPGSTLLALVMALASPELIRAAYAAAIERRYRFYSYGDAMLIL